MQNFHVVSRAKFNALSNGALGFAVSLILYTGKWINLFKEIVLAFKLHFQHIGLNLEENQVHHSKKSEMVRIIIKILYLLCICT
jgi:hypothetical protein